VCAARDALQRSLGDATGALETTAAALDAARRDYESARSDIERLTRRESDLVSELADVCAARDTLERRLGDATGALREANAARRI
jgi:chromosome segregation ATPase